MSDTQAKVAAFRPGWQKVLIRVLTVLAVAVLIGAAMRHIAAALDQSPSPAGFPRGLLQGALMPAALPNLLVGSDVTIYAKNNNGVPYKLGYTCGVNACGALFFGIFFWRLNRWRRRVNGKIEP